MWSQVKAKINIDPNKRMMKYPKFVLNILNFAVETKTDEASKDLFLNFMRLSAAKWKMHSLLATFPKKISVI
jgi:hypothetical protein